MHLTMLSVALPELGKGRCHTRICVWLKALPKRFCKSVVIRFDGTYTKRSDDAGAKIGGKLGIYHTNFLLVPIKEVPIKASPCRGQ